MTFENVTLYKYRAYNAHALEIFVNTEIYFASPASLNDPYDCRVNIRASLDAAIARAAQVNNKTIQERLERFKKIDRVYEKMDRDLSNVGVFSLFRTPLNVLMWSHYAANHSGFWAGFRLTERLTTHRNTDHIVGATDVLYTTSNPFSEYFEDIVTTGKRPDWEEFWLTLLSVGISVKAESWQHEEEVRILRQHAGQVQFSPSELVEVVFGLSTSPENKVTIRRILSGAQWAHVRFRETVRTNTLALELRDAT